MIVAIFLGCIVYFLCGCAVTRSFPQVGNVALMLSYDGAKWWGFGLLLAVTVLWPIFLILMAWVSVVGID